MRARTTLLMAAAAVSLISASPAYAGTLQGVTFPDTATVAGKAVRVKLSIAGVGGAAPIVVTHTSHAVAVADHWTWILPPERFAEYRAGRCPR